MKSRLTSILCCPFCNSDLSLEIFETRTFKLENNAQYMTLSCPHAIQGECNDCKDKDITEGVLECQNCKKIYPIVNSVPRMLNESINQFPEFVAKFTNQLSKYKKPNFATGNANKKLQKEYRQVARHFQSQWKFWGTKKRSFGRDIEASLNYLLWTMTPQGTDKTFFEQKLILDAGCGHGKFLLALSTKNVESVGLDITRAIDLCQDLLSQSKSTHLVQGDVIHPPFEKGRFDYVYSSGVIHHTPDTKAAFKSLSQLPKKGGVYSVWVYPFRAPWWEFVQGNLRKVTTRMHPQVLRVLSYAPVPLLSFSKLSAYSGTSLKNSSWSECAQVVFDFYGPKYQTHHSETEIKNWFSAENYSNLTNGPDPTSVTGIKN